MEEAAEREQRDDPHDEDASHSLDPWIAHWLTASPITVTRNGEAK
jgi:hypothetical protein